MASIMNLPNTSLQGLKQLPASKIVADEAHIKAVISFAKTAESIKSLEGVLELETFLRGLYYGLESDLNVDGKIKLVERVVQPLMGDSSWTHFYNQVKSGAYDAPVEQTGTKSRKAGDSSLIGIIPYIVDDYKFNPQFQAAAKTPATTVSSQMHTS